MVPIMTDLPAAPKTLLKFFSYKCVSLLPKIHVEQMHALATKNGLKYMTACRDCRGLNFLNADDIIKSDEEDLELEDDNAI